MRGTLIGDSDPLLVLAQVAIAPPEPDSAGNKRMAEIRQTPFKQKNKKINMRATTSK